MAMNEADAFEIVEHLDNAYENLLAAWTKAIEINNDSSKVVAKTLIVRASNIENDIRRYVTRFKLHHLYDGNVEVG